MEIDEINGNDGHIYRLKAIDEIKEMFTTERNELSTKYNSGVNIIGLINNCLGVTAIGLGVNGFGLISTIVAAPAVSGIEAVSVVMRLLRVVGNRTTKMLSLKIENMKRLRC